MATINRGYTPKTSRLLREYLAQTYPNATRIAEFHLTKPNPEAVARAGGQVSPRFGGAVLGYPDAAVITPGEVALWEAKDLLTGAALGQLEAYGMLWPLSVESHDYPDHKLTLHLLAARDNPPVRAMAEAKGVAVVIYTPPWWTQNSLRTEAAGAQRVLDARAGAIVSRTIAGLIPRAAAEQQLEALGLSAADAAARIDAAAARVPQPLAPPIAL